MINEAMFPVKEVPAVYFDKNVQEDALDKTGHKFIVREDTGRGSKLYD
jgi:hypothetical protein